MGLRSIKKIQDVVDWGLCIGCGACVFMCDRGAVSLVNIDSIGIRAKFEKGRCENCTECLSVCPGYRLEAGANKSARAEEMKYDHLIGPALEIWEGHAADPEIRFAGSSGGILSALALYCLEKEGMKLALHVGMDSEKPWLNKTVASRNRKDLLAGAGSRYAPSSPCEALRTVEEGVGSSLFIGKPCDTAAVTMARKKRPVLDSKLGLVLTFFCAGAPGTQGTLNLLKQLKIEAGDIKELRYRGHGWPGNFTAIYGAERKEKALNYEESWGALAKHPRSFRCHLCPDGLGEIADISCGDAWHRYPDKNNPGLSLVLVRSERGKEVLRKARAEGYVILKPAGPAEVIAAQGLIQRRRQIFGRLLAMRMFLIPTPNFDGFELRQAWQENSLLKKSRMVAGTIKRIIRRGMWHRNHLFPI